MAKTTSFITLTLIFVLADFTARALKQKFHSPKVIEDRFKAIHEKFKFKNNGK